MNYKDNNNFFNGTFKEITLDDFKTIDKYLKKHDFLSCEQNFVNIFSWSNHYPVKWCYLNNSNDIVLFYEEENILMMPNEELSLSKLNELCQFFETETPLIIGNVSEEYIQNNHELEDYFEIEFDDNFSEYVYNANDLINLKGKKLRKKKSHINKFFNEYSQQKIEVKSLMRNQQILFNDINFDYENVVIDHKEINYQLNENVCSDCINFLEKHFSASGDMPTDIEDFTAINTALKHAESLNLDGIVIYINGEVIAFALFSKQNFEAFTVHFEKINHNFIGASQFLNYCSAIYLKQQYNCTLINREQDLGIEGLRHAKRSYAPQFMLKQYQLKHKSSNLEK